MSEETIGTAQTPYYLWCKEQQNAPGNLSPCPFCKMPRNQRTDYIRCRSCGINWLQGENLDKDPRIQRTAEALRIGGINLRPGKGSRQE